MHTSNQLAARLVYPMKRCATVIFTVGLFCALTGSPARAEGLIDALVSAYETSPELQAQRASLRATDETVAQALSGWRPRVTASGSYGRTRIRTEQPLTAFGLPGSQSNDRIISPIGAEIAPVTPPLTGSAAVPEISVSVR